MAARINGSADVNPRAVVGDGTTIWLLAQGREGAVLGRDCVVGRGGYIGPGVRIADVVKIQNAALVYEPATLAHGVFVGPAAVLTNDLHSRAVDPDGIPNRAEGAAAGYRDPSGCRALRDAHSVSLPARARSRVYRPRRLDPVLATGKQVRIAEVAQTLIRMSGRVDVPNMVYTGLRLGEKLSEDLFAGRETGRPTAHGPVTGVDTRELNGDKIGGFVMRSPLHAKTCSLSACGKNGSALRRGLVGT